MAVMNYLTQCTFDFGALGALPKILAGFGVKRPFVVTDPGLKAAGLVQGEVDGPRVCYCIDHDVLSRFKMLVAGL